MLLVGDIGGTKTTLTLYSLPLDVNSPILEMTYKSRQFGSLVELIQTFLKGKEGEITAAVFGAAGPVIHGSVRITNLPWKIAEDKLEKALAFDKVWIINDLEAIANSIPHLTTDDLLELHPGEPIANETIAVIAPGTGLGEAFLTWEQGVYRPHDSEGGHTDFGPTSRRQSELLDYMLEKYEHVSYERLCSGIGIPNIYSFVISLDGFSEPDWLAKELGQTEDPTPVIVNAASDEQGPCPACVETIRLFTSILGAECGNLALKFKALGGVYIGGGMIPKMKHTLDTDLLRQAYVNKGRFKGFVSNIPLRLILNPNAAVIGAAHYAEENMENQNE